MIDAVRQTDRQRLADARRWVVKVGSALLTNDGRGLDASVVKVLADQLAALRSRGSDVVLVSSGAIVAVTRAHVSMTQQNLRCGHAVGAEMLLVGAHQRGLPDRCSGLG